MALSLIKSLGKAVLRGRGHFTAEIMGERFKVDPYHIAFWRAVTARRWETSTFDVQRQFLTPEATYLDIGAWIGPTALHASRLCKEVYAFEPDPVALHYLNWNISLNRAQNITPLGVALAAESGMFEMASFGDAPGDSMTSLLQAEGEGRVKVLALSWAEFLQRANPAPPALIKMDVEGAEFELLPTMRAYLEREKPALFLSTHAPYLGAGNEMDGMQALRETLSFYPKIHDEALQPISPEALTRPEACAGFGTYLFSF